MASSANTWCKKLMAKQKKYLLRHAKARWAFDADGKPVVKVREYLAPVDVHFVPKRRGSGCRMSHEKRLLILERSSRRAEFFAALRGE